MSKIYSYFIKYSRNNIVVQWSHNASFTKALGKVLHRPTLLPLPTQILKLVYGEASCVLTDSKEVYPQRLLDNGFKFKYPTIDDTLKDVFC
jgi:NAD dependent epimerase/dehydratase family enzyme